MVLIDTSVWVNHLRAGNDHLKKLLLEMRVSCHPFIVGELACGNIKNRKEFLSLIQTLPMVQSINEKEFLYFVEQNNLIGKGVGFVDVHLLASARLSEISLWSFDKKLDRIASYLDINYSF